MDSKPTVYIHTNDKQLLGAKVAAYSMKSRSRHPDRFDVKLIRLEETPHLLRRQGATYLRKGRQAVWLNEDLQSFSPLRMMVPQLMGYRDRAVVTDPDVFAVGDIYELLSMDMGGKAVFCRNVSDGYKGNGHSFHATSVMLLDCERLRHWRWDEDIDNMFAGRLDYGPWIGLKNEPKENIGELDEAWNSFDKLTPETRLLHTTERSTQPWRTGLPVDFDLTTAPAAQARGARSMLSRWFGGSAAAASAPPERYKPHPDPAQEKLFFELLRGAIEAGEVELPFVEQCIRANDVRHDAFDILKTAGLRA